MIDINTVINDVSLRLGLDKELVATVCKHPYKCVVNLMNDDDEYRDILFNRLFKFKLKRRYKEDKTKPYSTK